MADGGEQLLTLSPLDDTETNFFDFGSDLPVATDGVLAHGGNLQGKRLLIMGGDSGIESYP